MRQHAQVKFTAQVKLAEDRTDTKFANYCNWQIDCLRWDHSSMVNLSTQRSLRINVKGPTSYATALHGPAFRENWPDPSEQAFCHVDPTPSCQVHK